MQIAPSDESLLKAFLEREADDYFWANEIRQDKTGEERRKNSISRMESMIKENLFPISGADFVCIQSITNIGLVCRELRLTGQPFESGVNVEMSLPPNPRNGGVSCRLVNRWKTKPFPRS